MGIESKSIQSKTGNMKVIPDVTWGNDEDLKQFEELLHWADIVHIHNQPPLKGNSKGWEILSKVDKPFVYQLHGEPEVVIHKMLNVIKKWITIDRIVCIAQYQAVQLKTFLQDDFYPVRNIIDIHDPLLQYKKVDNEKVVVTYSPSNMEPLDKLKRKRGSTWAYKSYKEIMRTFVDLNKRNVIHPEVIYKETFENCMKKRAEGDIHIDDIYTGSYHLSSLEGLSQGKVVIANLANWMIQYLVQFLGCEIYELPWVLADKHTLATTIEELVNDKEVLKKLQRDSRIFMEKHWNNERVLNDYLKVYEGLNDK
jgi:glycosyltransferase involved in cell wall biosynthesis